MSTTQATISQQQAQARLLNFCELDAALSSDAALYVSSFEQQFGNPPIDLSQEPPGVSQGIVDQLKRLQATAPNNL